MNHKFDYPTGVGFSQRSLEIWMLFRFEEILFRKDLEKWRSRFDLETHLTVDRATGSWKGNVGVVTTLIGRAPFDPMLPQRRRPPLCRALEPWYARE